MTTTQDPNVDRIARYLAEMVVDFMQASLLADPDWDAEALNRFGSYAALVALVGYEDSDDYIEREQNRR